MLAAGDYPTSCTPPRPPSHLNKKKHSAHMMKLIIGIVQVKNTYKDDYAVYLLLQTRFLCFLPFHKI
jgi:hypothetical protein